MEVRPIRGWDSMVPGCRWLHEPPPISDQLMGVGFPHRAGRCRSGESPYSSPIGRSFRIIEGLLLLPECRETLMNPFSIKLLGKDSGLWHGLGHLSSCHNCDSQILSQPSKAGLMTVTTASGMCHGHGSAHHGTLCSTGCVTQPFDRWGQAGLKCSGRRYLPCWQTGSHTTTAFI